MKEIDRILFVTLEYSDITHLYYVLNDLNFVEKFFAHNDDEAREYFHNKYGK